MSSSDQSYTQALYKATMAINSILEPQEMLKKIVESTANAMNVKACSVLLLSPDRKKLFHGATYGLSEKYIKKGSIKVDLSMPETFQGNPVCVLDASIDPRIQYGNEAAEEGISSILSVPMMLHNQIIGELRIYSSEKRVFTEDDIQLLEAIASISAIALENARLFAELKNSYDTACQNLLEWYGSGRETEHWFDY